MKAHTITLLVVGAAAIVLVGAYIWQVTRPAAEIAAQANAPRPESCEDPAAAVTIHSVHPMTPDWAQLAPNAVDAGGGWTYWGRNTIRRCGAQEARIAIETRYAREQLYGEAGAGFETIIRYMRARSFYRLMCEDQTYALIERQILGPNDEVVATEAGQPDNFRPRTPVSPVGGDIFDTACTGA